MARVAVVGAATELVTALVTRALDLQHVVSVFTAKGVRFKMSNERVTLYQGSLTGGDALDAALERCRYVFCACEPGGEASLERVLAALLLHVDLKVKRVVFFSRVGAARAVAKAQGLSGLMGSLFSGAQHAALDDFARAEGVLRDSALPYLVLRLPKLSAARAGDEVLGVPLRQELTVGPLAHADAASFAFDVLQDPMLERAELAVGSGRRLASSRR